MVSEKERGVKCKAGGREQVRGKRVIALSVTYKSPGHVLKI